jgi:hypothetical protein
LAAARTQMEIRQEERPYGNVVVIFLCQRPSPPLTKFVNGRVGWQFDDTISRNESTRPRREIKLLNVPNPQRCNANGWFPPIS